MKYLEWFGDLILVFMACVCFYKGQIETGMMFMILDQLCRIRKAIEGK